MKLNYLMPAASPTGWGNLSLSLSKSLTNNGVTISRDQEAPVLVAIADHSFNPINCIPDKCKPVIGIGFCEFDKFALDNASDNISRYTHVICGSVWMKNMVDRIIQRDGLKTTTSAHVQGVDHSIFKSIERKWGQRPFVVGSFGKYEFRKGQDVVFAAFAEFAQTKDDVFLKCGWNNPWPMTMMTPHGVTTKHRQGEEIWYRGDSQASYFTKLLIDQGINQKKMIILDPIQKPEDMAEAYRSCSVGFFPNRMEAGSNLCLQEMISCGIPCIATQAHGHLDLEGSYFPIKGVDLKKDGSGNSYYEPCFGDCVVALERAYQDKLYLDMEAVKKVSDTWTWDALAKHVIEVIGAN